MIFGFPNMVERNKKAFQSLLNRLRSCISSWCVQPLSQGGKEVFVKNVLQATSTFTMSCFLLSASFFQDMKCLISYFWWKKFRSREAFIGVLGRNYVLPKARVAWVLGTCVNSTWPY